MKILKLIDFKWYGKIKLLFIIIILIIGKWYRKIKLLFIIIIFYIAPTFKNPIVLKASISEKLQNSPVNF